MPAPSKEKIIHDESAESGRKIKSNRIDLKTCHFEVELRFHRVDKKIEWKGTNVDVIQRFTVMFPILNHAAPAGTHHRPSQRHPITRSYHYHNQWIICSDLQFSLSLSYRLIRALVITRELQGWEVYWLDWEVWWFGEYFTFQHSLNHWSRVQSVSIPWFGSMRNFSLKMLATTSPSLSASPSYTRWNCVDLRDINLDFHDSLFFSRQRV